MNFLQSSSPFFPLILLALLQLLAPSFLSAQKFATLDGGQRIVVYDDGTWEEHPDGTRTILSSQIIGDELHLTISDNGKETKLVEKIVVSPASTEEKINCYVNGAHKRWRDPYSLIIITSKIQIGTELFVLTKIENPINQNLYYREKKRKNSSQFPTPEQGLYCASTQKAFARSYQYRNGDQGKVFEDTKKQGAYSLEEAKVLAANMYREILAIRLMD